MIAQLSSQLIQLLYELNTCFVMLTLCVGLLFILHVSCEYALFDKSDSEPALLVVSFDGFRPNYLYRDVTPTLNEIRLKGTSARFMLPVFPTKTFVNHFSIATVSNAIRFV